MRYLAHLKNSLRNTLAFLGRIRIDVRRIREKGLGFSIYRLEEDIGISGALMTKFVELNYSSEAKRSARFLGFYIGMEENKFTLSLDGWFFHAGCSFEGWRYNA